MVPIDTKFLIVLDSLFALVVNAPAGSLVTVDHCDLRGWADEIGVGGPPSPFGQLVITDNWIHKSRNPGPVPADHTDGILPGSFGVANALIRHNTIAAIGNTNGIGLQHLFDPWVSTTSYLTGQFVKGSDNNLYKSIKRKYRLQSC